MIANSNHWIIEQTKVNSSKPAIVCEQKTLSYFDFFEECKNLTYYLIESGIKENTHVGILLNHSFEFYIAINSIWLIGAVVIPLNPKSKREELKFQIEKADINFIITNLENETNQIFNAKIISIKNIDRTTNDKKLIFNDYKSDSNALIMFTSGSTGKPKAVVHTFNSLFNHVKNLNEKIILTSEDKWLASLPLFHIGGYMILIRALLSGGVVIFPKSLKVEDMSKSFKYLPTHASFVTTMLNNFLEKNISLPESLKYIFVGGGPIDFNLYKIYKEKFGVVIKVYGSTETCSMVSALFPKDDFENSLGKPISNSIAISILKNSNDKSGEILVKSDSLFKEYYNDQTTTSEKFTSGFYKTGDYGYVNENGFLFLENRREDIIISGGENISKIEVENEIKNISGVEDVFVFGINDNYWGEIVCALIQSKTLTQDEIYFALKKNLSSYKMPKKIFFTEKIPRTDLGKISKKEILDLLNLSDE